MKSYMYVFVREDLSIPQRAVQAGHAILEASSPFHDSDLDHPSIILLGVANEEELEQVYKELFETKFNYAIFREPHYNDSLTALAVFPVFESERTWFKDYKLMK